MGSRSGARSPAPSPQAWTAGLFVEQLQGLLAHLGFAEAGGFHLLGHSWGGMLAQEYVFGRPSGLRSLVLSDTSASARRIMLSMAPLLAALSAEEPDEQLRRVLFVKRHACRVDPMPEEVERAYEMVSENPGVFLAMMGGLETEVTGTLRDWDAVPRLPEIAVPTLVLAGEHDELQPVAWQPLAEHIPGARAHVFAGASHMPFLESPDEYHAVVSAFLAEHEGEGAPA